MKLKVVVKVKKKKNTCLLMKALCGIKFVFNQNDYFRDPFLMLLCV